MKKRTVKKIILGIGIPLLIVGLTVAVFPLSNAIYHVNTKAYCPDYEQIDLSAILDKESKTTEDYNTLLKQTGLTKVGIDSLLEQNKKQEILKVQTDFFLQRTIWHNDLGYCLCEDKVKEYHRSPVLKAGDIIVDPYTHWGPFRGGHSAMALEDGSSRVFSLDGYGYTSGYDPLTNYTDRIGLYVLRPTCDQAKIDEVVSYVKDNLFGVSYNIFAGVFCDRDKQTMSKSNCSHILWYAYYKCGVDIDGGTDRIITPLDFLSTDKLTTVQVLGLDPSGFAQ